MDRAATSPPNRDETLELAHHRAHYLTGLYWHLGVFVIVNAFFWLLDLGLGVGGADWAYWITIIWGFALAFHVLAWLIDGRDVELRLTKAYSKEMEAEREGV
jgi:hypothetical protein